MYEPKIGDEVWVTKNQDPLLKGFESVFTNDMYTVLDFVNTNSDGTFNLLLKFQMNEARMHFVKSMKWRHDSILRINYVTITEDPHTSHDLSKMNSLCRR